MWVRLPYTTGWKVRGKDIKVWLKPWGWSLFIKGHRDLAGSSISREEAQRRLKLVGYDLPA
jgi:hypothetical protein